MRAMNKFRRNLGIFTYPQQYKKESQWGGGTWGDLAKSAASAAGRQLGESVKKEAKDYIKSGKLQKTISSLMDNSEEEEEEEEETVSEDEEREDEEDEEDEEEEEEDDDNNDDEEEEKVTRKRKRPKKKVKKVKKAKKVKKKKKKAVSTLPRMFQTGGRVIKKKRGVKLYRKLTRKGPPLNSFFPRNNVFL